MNMFVMIVKDALSELIPIMTFALVLYLGNPLDLATMMLIRKVLDSLREPLEHIPNFYNELQRVKVAMEKVTNFMKLHEVQQNIISVDASSEYAVNIRGNFSWGFATKETTEDQTKNSENSAQTDEKLKPLSHYISLKDINL